MALIERIQNSPDATYWPGKIPMTYIYTAGRAGEAFFKKLRDQGKFIGARCEDCDLTYFPPRIFCERCFDHLDEWVEVPPTGRIYTFTTVHLDLDGNHLPEPRLMAFGQLDGADGGLVHYVGEAQPEDICIGTRVEAVFKDKKERKGVIRDIEYFRPVTTC